MNMKYQGAVADLDNITLKGRKITTLEYLPKELPKLKKLIINSTEIKTLKLLPTELNKLEYLELINNKIKTLIQLPRELPSLTKLIIDEPYLKSLEKIPKNMPRLKTLILPSQQILDLDCIIKYIKNLENLSIGPIRSIYNQKEEPSYFNRAALIKYTLNRRDKEPSPLNLERMSSLEKFPNLPNLKTFQVNGVSFSNFIGLPEKLLKMNDFTIRYCKFINFIGLPQKLPNLNNFTFKYCKFNNFIGFPKTLGKKSKITFEECEIGSFEGLNVEFTNNIQEVSRTIEFSSSFEAVYGNPTINWQLENKKSKNVQLEIKKSIIYSFEGLPENSFEGLPENSNISIFRSSIVSFVGLSRTNLLKILAKLYFAVYYSRKNFIKLSSRGMQLIEDCFDKDYHEDLVLRDHFEYHRKWYELKIRHHPKEYYEDTWDMDPSFQDMMELFITEKVDLLYEYYKKNKIQLACQYKDDPKSLSGDEIDRLLNEANYEVLKILEGSVSNNDPVLLKLIEKFAVTIKNGYKIL